MNQETGKRDLSKFHHYNSKGVPISPFDFAILEDIKRNYNLFVCGGIDYIYERGVYNVDLRGTKLKEIIKSYLFDNFIKSRTINQIFNLVIDDDSLQKKFEDLNQHPASWICFLDVIVDAETMTEHEHAPHYYFLNQIPFKWLDCKNAPTGVETEKFLHFAIPDEEDREMNLEFSGLEKTCDTRQQKMLLKVGTGSTGKSISITLNEKSVGASNIASIGLQDLSRRFSTSNLLGKTMNSCSDLPADALTETGTVKRLIGEDRIFAERKGHDGFSFTNYAKCEFSCNSLPDVFCDKTSGFFRRILILEMKNQPEQPDPHLAEKLERELPYYVKITVEALHRMYQRGYILESKNSKKAVRQMRKDSDSVESWILDFCETSDKSARLERNKAFQSFSSYCETEERTPLSKNKFFKVVREKNFGEIRGKTERFFTGIRIKNGDDFMTVTEDELTEIPFK